MPNRPGPATARQDRGSRRLVWCSWLPPFLTDNRLNGRTPRLYRQAFHLLETAPRMDDADPLQRDATGIGSLADPMRRRLYRFVCAQSAPVGRDQAADAVGIPHHQAKFHLDRLTAEGLLETDFARLTGRSGPGAGRTAKLYRRARRDIAISLPHREYEL